MCAKRNCSSHATSGPPCATLMNKRVKILPRVMLPTAGVPAAAVALASLLSFQLLGGPAILAVQNQNLHHQTAPRPSLASDQDDLDLLASERSAFIEENNRQLQGRTQTRREAELQLAAGAASSDKNPSSTSAPIVQLSSFAEKDAAKQIQDLKLSDQKTSNFAQLASPWALCRKRNPARCESETEAESPGLQCDKVDFSSSPHAALLGQESAKCTHHITQPIFCFEKEDGNCIPLSYCEKAQPGSGAVEPWHILYGSALFEKFDTSENEKDENPTKITETKPLKCQMKSCEKITFASSSGDAKEVLAHKVRVCSNAFATTNSGSLQKIRYPLVCEYSQRADACKIRNRKEKPYPEAVGADLQGGEDDKQNVNPDEKIEKVFGEIQKLSQWVQGNVQEAFKELEQAKKQVSEKLRDLEKAAENRRVAKQKLVDYLAYRRFQVQTRTPALAEVLQRLSRSQSDRLMASGVAGADVKKER
ncbi:unnamed protein product [Amoebophrya sp. A120]|nr:unnamed protein product [Amoebophrya sp. A120]|eukprot:GSA120T00007797001.1